MMQSKAQSRTWSHDAASVERQRVVEVLEPDDAACSTSHGKHIDVPIHVNVLCSTHKNIIMRGEESAQQLAKAADSDGFMFKLLGSSLTPSRSSSVTSLASWSQKNRSRNHWALAVT